MHALVAPVNRLPMSRRGRIRPSGRRGACDAGWPQRPCARAPFVSRRVACCAQPRKVTVLFRRAGSIVAIAIFILACAGPLPAPRVAQAHMARGWADELVYMVVTDRFARGGSTVPLPDVNQANPQAWHGGNLRGLIDKLGYLDQLGVSTLWITPVVLNQPGGYHGYWPLDLGQLDPHLGTMGDLKELVAKAHQHQIRVLADVVVNHLGPQHPWLRDPARRDWFHPHVPIANASSQRQLENGWLTDLPDLNTEHPAVAEYLTATAKRLAEQSGVDGYRVGEVNYVPQAFWEQWSTQLRKGRQTATGQPFFLLGDVRSTDYAVLAPYYHVGFDALADFATYEAIKSAFGHDGSMLGLVTVQERAAQVLADTNLRATFLDSHDVPRFISDARGQDPRRLDLALAYLLTAPGMPVLYYGTEVGLADQGDLPWGKPATSPIFAHARALGAARLSHAAMRRGDFTVLPGTDDGHLLYRRSYDVGGVWTDNVFVALNNTDQPYQARIDTAGLRLPWGVRFVDAFTGKDLAPRSAGVVYLMPRLPTPTWVWWSGYVLAAGALSAVGYWWLWRRRRAWHP